MLGKETGRCEGRKKAIELNPQLLSEARRLRRKNPVSGKRLSYQKVANQLYELGYVTASGKPYQQDFVYRMLICKN